jgi:hypothetical protein
MTTEQEKAKELLKKLQKEVDNFVYPVKIIPWPPTKVDKPDKPTSTKG